jgi:hypothetical protein
MNVYHRKKDFGKVNNQQENFLFCFDRILNNSSQEEVYDAVGDEQVQYVLKGIDGK